LSTLPPEAERPGWAQRSRPLAIALVATVIASLPPFLVGGLGVELEHDLGVSLSQLGATVSAYFAASALCSAAMGRLGHRLGPARSMAISSAISAVSLLGIFATADSFATLVPWLAVAGVANALAQPSVNGFLSGGVGGGDLGLALGVKQSAIPLASLLSGASVPILVLTVGWRGGFAAAALLALCFSLSISRLARPHAVRAEREGRPDTPPRTLAAMGAAAGLGSVAGNSLGAFLVSSAVAGGAGQSEAGLMLAGGSAVCVLVRLTAGAWVDRSHGDGLGLIAVLLVVGAAGFFGLASALPLLLLVSTVLAFGGGWGWPGLFQFSVVVHNPAAPALATGFTQTGTYVGAALGPLVFGLIASHSYPAAWGMVVVAMLAASALIARCRSSLAAGGA
jgi:MFS family permease